MTIHLIIDGYNVIRQSLELQLLDARELEAGRTALLARLAAYRERHHHKITVVFDGWLGGAPNETRDRRQGMLIIYSRLGEKADEVIKRLLAADRQRAVVVTSDREIQDWAQGVGAAWIAAGQFERLHLLAQEGEAAEESDDAGTRSPKKGPARRLPKAQRRRQHRLKKL
ncbi:MAG: NYN domain-containing protein [Deltaproteobacteria bacterium]|nr:NYN domain-containing protein [Deltaproteobacteria bacterium]